MAVPDSNNFIDINLKNHEHNQINLIKDQKEISDIEYDLIYKNFMEFKEGKKLKIFDKIFINNNIDKCEIIYKDKDYKLREYLDDIDKDYRHSQEKEIKIKLRINQDITRMSYMFCNCDRLLYVKDAQKENYSNNNTLDLNKNISEYNKLSEENLQKEHIIGTDENNIFNNNIWIDQNNSIPSSISLQSDNNSSYTNKMIDIIISNNSQFYNINDMCKMFSGCSSLISLPDISNWNTSSVNNMSYIFNGCSSIISLPDLSKWNTSNVEDISYIFY